MQLTRQIGEHLIVAELGRRELLATPFAGNVPAFDLLVADQAGHAIPIQVKAINGPSWQFSARTFLNIQVRKSRQEVTGVKRLAHPDLVCVFVLLQGSGVDQFYIFRLRDLQSHFRKTYTGRKLPQNIESTHCAIWPTDLARFKDNWALIFTALESDGLTHARRAARGRGLHRDE